MTPAHERRLARRRMPALGPGAATMGPDVLLRIEHNYYTALFAGMSYPLGRALHIENRILNGDRIWIWGRAGFERMQRMHWKTALRWLQHWRHGGSLKALRYTAEQWRITKRKAEQRRRDWDKKIWDGRDI